MTRRPFFAILLLAVTFASLTWSFWPDRDHSAPSSPANDESVSNPLGQSSPPTSIPAAAASTPDARTIELLHARLSEALQIPKARPNEAVLTFATPDAYRRFLARAQGRGITILGQLDTLLTVRIRYDSLAALRDDMLRHPSDFAHVGANIFVQPPDPFAPVPRANGDPVPFRNRTLAFLGAAADRSTWGRGVTIAILDSGIAPDPTFDARLQYLNIGLGTLPGTHAHDGHGTSVASLAAGRSDNAPGVAPGATLLSVRVTDSSGTSDVFTVARAIVAAVDAGAPIINLSLGGHANASVLSAAIEYATSRGSVIVAAAGNDQAAHLSWPAADPRVISVGAVDALAEQVAFSNSGPQLQISAPGYGVQTAWLDGDRVYVNGTSASAPLVAGAIAAVMSQNPALTAEQAWSVVRQTASDAGAPGADPNYGNGVLNLDWAMHHNDPSRVDPAIATHHYDAFANRVDFVIQNRGGQTVSGLSLDVDTNGTTTSHRLPAIRAGESYVLSLPLDRATAAANGGVTFTTQLVTPIGLPDVNTANNRHASRLVLPTP